VQLGTVVDITPPGELALTNPDRLPDWVQELNQRYALVRHGSKLVIVDFQTPYTTLQGTRYGLGFLDIAGFRQKLKGRMAPPENPTDKHSPLAEAWLMHEGRRQYEGLSFAPGEALPSNMLNMFQGYAVEPVEGDVTLWLELLAALVPNLGEREYVLRWIAWKIQNPGGVPDTILIFTGAKGTGKNSLFDPILMLAGRHGMLADDPELIAGRFTWHLMSIIIGVLDEAVFIGDPRQSDRIKSRVTAKTMLYEQKGMDPVQGVNRCAYVMLTNHTHVWQATTDERRAVVIEVGEALRVNLEFFKKYHAWVKGPGPAALLHYLQSIDLTDFNPRQIPKGEALRKQIEQTALRAPVNAWWYQCLTEGCVRWRADGEHRVHLHSDELTTISREALRMSFEQSAGARGRSDWAAAAKRLGELVGPSGIQKTRLCERGLRIWHDMVPPLGELKEAFTAATKIKFDE